MKTTFQAIFDVADKRHGRLCKEMPEHEAAKAVCLWLDHMLNVHKENKCLCARIAELKEAYQINLRDYPSSLKENTQ